MSGRVGIGVDAHRRVTGRKLYLGGVEIPSEFGLEAHSDGDVIVHALIDALLGAAALGDIGKHFPPADESYRDIRSTELLSRTMVLLADAGYRVNNVDVTVMCQEPKLQPHVEEMRTKLSSILRIDPGSVSVKGTTLEGMGFTGRREGIAATAVVLIEESV